MRKINLIVTLFFCISLLINAQAPNMFNYQASIRNGAGLLLSSQQISVRVRLLQGSMNGTPVYTETHNVTTSEYGIVNIIIGTGNSSDNFESIGWKDGPFFLKVEIDEEGGASFIELGTTQLLSVPYSLYAEHAGALTETDWKRKGNDLYYNEGKIGIGTDIPKSKLHILGYGEGLDRAFIRLRNTDESYNSSVSMALESNDGIYGSAFTQTSASYTAIPDFDRMGVISTNGKGFSIYSVSDYGSIRFYTNKNQNGIIERMRIGANGNIGIGTNNPLRKLHIVTTSSDDENASRDLVLLRNLSSSNRAYACLSLVANEDAYGLGISFTSSNYNLIPDFQRTASIGTNGKALALSVTSPDGSIRFLTNPYQTGLIEMMRLDPHGNVGIGTSSPHSKLEIAGGDVYIKDISSGIIMISPNGQCWRGTLNNSGILEFTSISCP